MTTEISPYPAGSWYAVHKGFLPNVYESFHLLNAQIRGFEDAQYEVFATRQDAERYVQTGVVPEGVTPLAPNEPGERLASAATVRHSIQPNVSTKPLFRPARTTATPTPTDSSSVPANRTTSAVPPPLRTADSLPTRSTNTQATTRAPITSSTNRTKSLAVSPTRLTPAQPSAMPATPRKGKLVSTPETDEEGDTEPEDDVDGILGPRTRANPRTPNQSGQRTPTAGSASFSKPAPLGRTPTPGSLAAVLRRSQSSGVEFSRTPEVARTPTAPLPTVTAPLTTPTIPSTTAITDPINTSPKAKTKPARATGTSVPIPATMSTTPALPAQTAVSRPRVQPEAGPSNPHAGGRFRDCTHCDGSGRVPISGSDTDTSYERQRGAVAGSGLRKRAGSMGVGGGPRKRLSDARKQGGINGNGSLDKGKGKGKTTDGENEADEPTIPKSDYIWNLFLICGVLFLSVLIKSTVGFLNVLSMLYEFV